VGLCRLRRALSVALASHTHKLKAHLSVTVQHPFTAVAQAIRPRCSEKRSLTLSRHVRARQVQIAGQRHVSRSPGYVPQRQWHLQHKIGACRRASAKAFCPPCTVLHLFWSLETQCLRTGLPSRVAAHISSDQGTLNPFSLLPPQRRP